MAIGQVAGSFMDNLALYILHCANEQYYIGSIKNLSRRLKEHERGLVKSTYNKLPIKLVFSQSFSSLDHARKVERKLKSKKSKKIIEQIVQDGYIKFMRE